MSYVTERAREAAEALTQQELLRYIAALRLIHQQRIVKRGPRIPEPRPLAVWEPLPVCHPKRNGN